MICLNEPKKCVIRKKTDITKLCLVIAAGCFVTAGIGCVLNLLIPGAVRGEYLTIAGVFYLTLSGVNCIQTQLAKGCNSQIYKSKNRFDTNITEMNYEFRLEKTRDK